VYCATFTFSKRQFDESFHTLDGQIAAVARSLPGYLGEETWENAQTGQVSNIYYWRSLEELQALVSHPLHREAKRRQGEWLAGYKVVIAQVLRTYGDGQLQPTL
jgi:heme-degrading monooxygenase HmoA